MSDNLKNREFQLQFCETNLRWLAGEPPSEDRTRKEQFMAQEIARLKDEVEPVATGMCGRCLDDDVPLYEANCHEHPEILVGQPLGQYHCPDCGTVVVAGIGHPLLCRLCLERRHPMWDEPPSPETTD